jgi:hypothetical protein
MLGTSCKPNLLLPLLTLKPGTSLVFLLEEEKDMKPPLQRIYCLITLMLLIGLVLEAQAQKESFFNHFHWNKGYYAPAGSGARGLAINSLYRNYNDTTNHFLSLAVPVHKIRSAFGFYYLHNTSNQHQNIQSGLSYTAFLPVGQNGSLRLGVQANRHQHAISAKTWAFGEYQTDLVSYTGDASLFFQKGKLDLGLSTENLYHQGQFKKPAYSLLVGFRELRTNDWLQSTPYMLMRLKAQELPEWRLNYSATIANFLIIGSSYYKNSDYLYGFNAGFKICNSLWLTAATDFENLMLPYRAIYEFGLRLNIQDKRSKASFVSQPEEPLEVPLEEMEGF